MIHGVVMFSNSLPCNLSFPSCLGVPKDSGTEELLSASMGNREPVILNVYDMVSLGHFSDPLRRTTLVYHGFEKKKNVQ